MIGKLIAIMAIASAIAQDGTMPVANALAASTSSKPFSLIPEFSKRKIVLLHMHDRAIFFSRLGPLALANKARYAARHGYEMAYHTPKGTAGLWQPAACDASKATAAPLSSRSERSGDDGASSCLKPDSSFFIDARAPTFGKIKLALAACKTRPDYWALWTDADALVVNQTVPLESIIDDHYDIQLTTDWLMINAGMILFKCSKWTQKFLERVYAAREFDKARALDQSAFQHFFDTEPDMKSHLKQLPKYAMNVYTEEYRPGDFLLHMAGKLYEATSVGTYAIANQFDILSMIDDYDDVASFFQGQYILNYYSGICKVTRSNGEEDHDCKPEDSRRLKMDERLLKMSSPNRYRHVGLRYYWLGNWGDIHDVKGWNDNRMLFDPSGSVFGTSNGESKNSNGEDAHDEL